MGRCGDLDKKAGAVILDQRLFLILVFFTAYGGLALLDRLADRSLRHRKAVAAMVPVLHPGPGLLPYSAFFPITRREPAERPVTRAQAGPRKRSVPNKERRRPAPKPFVGAEVSRRSFGDSPGSVPDPPEVGPPPLSAAPALPVVPGAPVPPCAERSKRVRVFSVLRGFANKLIRRKDHVCSK